MILSARPRNDWQMARSQVLWPFLATARSSGWTKFTSAGYMFLESTYHATIENDGKYIEWTNGGNLSPGTWRAKALVHTVSHNFGTFHILINGVDTGGRLASGNLGANAICVSNDFIIAQKTRGPLRLSVLSTAGGYAANIAQVILEKVSAGADRGSGPDDLPWIVSVPAASFESTSSLVNQSQGTTAPLGSQFFTGSAGGNLDYKVDLAQGTWILDVLFRREGNRGKVNVVINGVAVGALDFYGTNDTAIVSLSGIPITATGIQNVSLVTTTRNPLSSADFVSLSWLQFRRTA